MTPRTLIAGALIVGLAALTTIHRLGAADVCGSNEAVEAVFLQQMVEHDALLFPLENGRSPMYKPPLFHWTAVAIDRLAGLTKVTAFNLRLPAALYAIAGVILTIAFAYTMLGSSGAILAGLILTAAYQYLENARIGRVDMTLCFFETLALFAFIWWSAPPAPPAPAALRSPTPPLVQGEGARAPRVDEASSCSATRSDRGSDALRYLLAAALGLAVLAKGPVGAMLPGLAIAVFLVAERRLRDVWRLATPGPVIVALAIASSWYLACLLGRRYGFLDRQIGSENFGRFFGSLGAMAPWYYVKPVLLNSAPLSLLVPFAVFAALRTPAGEGNSPIAPGLDDSRALIAGRLLAIFWVVTVLFFTVAAYKRRAYLLPLWPASAVTLSWWLGSLTRSHYGKFLRPAVVAACAVLIVVNFFFLPRRELRECGGDSMRTAAAQIDRVVGPNEPLYLFGFEDEPAPLLFYLDRAAPRIAGKLGDAPPGYVITTAEAWRRLQPQALDLKPVFESTIGRPRLVLLHRGRAYAHR